MQDIGLLDLLNGLAGLAALVNSLFLWPQIKALQALVPRVTALEQAHKARRRGK